MNILKTLTILLPAYWGSPLHFSRHVIEYLKEQFPDQWLGYGGCSAELASMVAGSHSAGFPCMGLHEKHGV
jgi:hypothetical protein